MSGSKFYDANVIEQVAINAFYGWGYNFYREENQLRTDDIVIRNKVSWLLGATASSIKALESKFRKDNLRPRSRENPLPDSEVVEKAKVLESLVQNIMQLNAKIQAQPVPENDRMTQRYRQEKETLRKLIEFDKRLVGQVQLLRDASDSKTAEEILDNSGYIQEGLTAIAKTLEDRQAILQ
jgi:hypothetical protein